MEENTVEDRTFNFAVGLVKEAIELFGTGKAEEYVEDVEYAQEIGDKLPAIETLEDEMQI